jgi:hypothetical protein
MPAHNLTLLKLPACLVRKSWVTVTACHLSANTANSAASAAAAAAAAAAAGNCTHVLGSLQRSMYIMFLL